MAFIDDVKSALRIDGSGFDAEVSDMIAGCKKDLDLAGVDPDKLDESDAFYKRTTITYARANFDYDKDAQAGFQEAYDSMKVQMASAARYRKDVVV